jgi:uncharacterized protein YjgD (DUF1641 family)
METHRIAIDNQRRHLEDFYRKKLQEVQNALDAANQKIQKLTKPGLLDLFKRKKPAKAAKVVAIP